MAELTNEDKINLAGMLLNSIAYYAPTVPDEILFNDLQLYHKLTDERITLQYAKQYLVGKARN